MMSLTLPYHTGRRYVIDVVGNLTTLALFDNSVMSVLSLTQIIPMEFWREKWVLRLYLILGKSVESLIS